MDNATWAALTLTLTAIGAVCTWLTFQRRGIASALKVLSFALLPLAAYLTKTLQMFTEIASAITGWAGSLIVSPRVWLGITVAGIAVALFLISGALSARGIGTRGRSAEPRAKKKSQQTPAIGSGSPKKGAPAIDDDMAEIEAMLRNRGIN